MQSEGSLRELRAFHRALGDVTRMRIVQLLATDGELTVTDLRTRLRVSQPLLTWHLHRLRRAGIVVSDRHGREVLCSLDRTRFAELHERGFRVLMNRSVVGAA